MNCAVVVASRSSCSSPLPFAAKSAVQPLTSAPRRLFAPLHGPRSIRRHLAAAIVAVSRRDHGLNSPSNDNDDGPPSTSSSFPSPSTGRMVDEGMLVLRKRMRDAEMAEMNYEPPQNWADWERAYYTRYGSDVCTALGILQSYLLTMRPAFAFGAAAVIALSLPVSAGAVLVGLLQGTRAVGAGIGLW